jgi:hypothetical protein
LPEYVEVDSKAYRINAKDMFIGVKHYDGMPVEDVYRWLEAIMIVDANCATNRTVLRSKTDAERSERTH